MANVPIVEDYAAIARRVNEITSGNKDRFTLPIGVEILIASDVAMPVKFSNGAIIGLVLHVANPPKLVLVHIRSTETARGKLQELIEILRRVCPSLINDRHEMVMTRPDCDRLVKLLES